jgi:hypothetical protein
VTRTIKVATIGPSGVGKTSLITAIIDDAQRLLAGKPVSMVAIDETEALVHQSRDEARTALRWGEFKAGIEGSQDLRKYHIALRAGMGRSVEIPFDVLDYPGWWMSAEGEERQRIDDQWQSCLEHIAESVLLLLPIDATVVMEARTEEQHRAAAHLLELSAVEGLAREWVKYRIKTPDEPAMLILAPLKCETYFRDGSWSAPAVQLEKRVREEYQSLLRAVREELAALGTEGPRPSFRIIYAPIDTYGCVELVEAEWTPSKPRPGRAALQLKGHYRVIPPGIPQVRAAGVIVQELCKCIVAVQNESEAGLQRRELASLWRLEQRHAERKGFWGTIKYHLGEEAEQNRAGRIGSQQRISSSADRQQEMRAAIDHLAELKDDDRVRTWEEL